MVILALEYGHMNDDLLFMYGYGRQDPIRIE